MTGIYRNSIAFLSASICQGTMSLWCSISVSTTTSPDCKLNSPQDRATKLMASVVPLVITARLALYRCFSNIRHAS